MAVIDVSWVRKTRVKKDDPRGFSHWRTMRVKGAKIACCDCGLVHEYEYRLRNGYLQQRVRRAVKYTAAFRRTFKYTHKKATK